MHDFIDFSIKGFLNPTESNCQLLLSVTTVFIYGYTYCLFCMKLNREVNQFKLIKLRVRVKNGDLCLPNIFIQNGIVYCNGNKIDM